VAKPYDMNVKIGPKNLKKAHTIRPSTNNQNKNFAESIMPPAITMKVSNVIFYF